MEMELGQPKPAEAISISDMLTMTELQIIKDCRCLLLRNFKKSHKAIKHTPWAQILEANRVDKTSKLEELIVKLHTQTTKKIEETRNSDTDMDIAGQAQQKQRLADSKNNKDKNKIVISPELKSKIKSLGLPVKKAIFLNYVTDRNTDLPDLPSLPNVKGKRKQHREVDKRPSKKIKKEIVLPLSEVKDKKKDKKARIKTKKSLSRKFEQELSSSEDDDSEEDYVPASILPSEYCETKQKK